MKPMQALLMTVLLIVTGAGATSGDSVLSRDELSTIAGGCSTKYICNEDGLCHVGPLCTSTSSITDPCTLCGVSILGIYVQRKHYRCLASALGSDYNCVNGTDNGCGKQRRGHCDAITTGPYCNFTGSLTGTACTEQRRTCSLS
jgi:hypothetical protein